MPMNYHEIISDNPGMFNNLDKGVEILEPIDLSSGAFISDAIDEVDVRIWDDLNIDNILIVAGTGTGKSTFCYTTLSSIALKEDKRILFLTPRSFLTEQVRVEISKIHELGSNNIDVINYHSIAPLTKQELSIMKDKYKYIILDECHFFESDSSFNNKTDQILKKILMIDSTNIFMSATPGKLFEEYIINEGRKHKVYKFIKEQTVPKKIYMSFDSSSRDRLIQECLDTGQKAFIFISSARVAYKVYRQFKEQSTFVCSSHNKDYAKHMHKGERDYFIHTNKIPKEIIITTSVLSTGINIKDENLGLVYVDSLSSSEVKQAIGRDRLGVSRVVIANQNNKRIAANKRVDEERLNIAYEYIRHMTVVLNGNSDNNVFLYNEFLDRYGNDLIAKYPNMFSVNTDNTLSLNDSSKLAAKMRIKDYNLILEEGYIGFIKNHLLREFNVSILKVETDLAIKEQQDAYKTAEEYEGIKLFGKQRNKLINELNFIDKHRNRQIRGRGSIDKELRRLTNNIYSLQSKRDTKRKINNRSNNNYGKVYWIVEKIGEDLTMNY